MNPQQIGKPLDVTAEALDQAAEVTTVDVMFARAFWQRYAPPRYLDLLDALLVRR